MKPLSAGSEIDAWCTKCKMDLGHRIIAMVGGQPKRVICQTCNSQHNYRAPKSAPSKVVTRGGAVVSARTTGASKPPPGAPKVTAKAKAEADRVVDWESRIAGQPVTAFTRYAMTRKFREGELVNHSKFGDGFVVGAREDGKVDIMFRDGVKTLAHGQS